ncbi:circadian clock protein KaiC [Pseudohoeflea coraliihabitans]|uniref:non-specific serine/threonine protein kinase n=1 Tax=Pseudohoeflea coraliihabitans TaxID=2860393 RepID=A0ABS6WN78_9HYPH|nr:circadian clock protein KaiC [Pseudohoeflea sp. DP4N28-3]MBW3097406.1 circadian clock protein KaiC [Pseudohoeflea sp. DP4N28-3]
MNHGSQSPGSSKLLPKSLTGISGLDDITAGGLPTGRPTLLCGAAGCGKTLFGMTFLVDGAVRRDEPGVFVSFEETAPDLAVNVASLGYEVDKLIDEKKLVIDHVRVDRSEIEEAGEYDLEGLFVRLGYAIDSIGAKRIVLDTLETLFAGLDNVAVLRSELRRLFEWIKQKGITAIVTAERGEGQLTRHGLEEYVSDCVILLENRVEDQITTRRLRVVKYRGSAHGTNEYPFLIDDHGITVLPITSAGLSYDVSEEPVPTGVEDLDAMLSIGGYYRGSSVLISGSAGTGKTIFSAHFANAACARGEHCLYVALEESPSQIVRNVRSVGLDLQHHIDADLLRFEAARPSFYGFEMHLTRLHRIVETFKPTIVVIDPISAFRGPAEEVHSTLLRVVDMLKARGITAVFTSLTPADERLMSDADRGVSSLMDTWISLLDIESSGERNRGLYVLKSRGMSNSNQIREYRLTSNGVQLSDMYMGPDGMLTGSARIAQEWRARTLETQRQREIACRRRKLERKRLVLEGQIAELQATLAMQEAEIDDLSEAERLDAELVNHDRQVMARSRGVDE